ncbi:MAG: hypothetical protein OQL27_09200, partial [Sedimenticola sp.]|nr:hypothetical protein [Sedimenticola sp.]
DRIVTISLWIVEGFQSLAGLGRHVRLFSICGGNSAIIREMRACLKSASTLTDQILFKDNNSP